MRVALVKCEGMSVEKVQDRIIINGVLEVHDDQVPVLISILKFLGYDMTSYTLTEVAGETE